MPSVISGDANVSATEFGYLDGVTSALQTQIDGKLAIADGGKLLQVVRATDSTRRSTTSGTYVDATGMTITITPTKNNSAIIVILNALTESGSTTSDMKWQITDSSNNTLSGASACAADNNIGSAMQTSFGYSTPATTSATTYKVRFLAGGGGTAEFRNDLNPAQLYALEIGA